MQDLEATDTEKHRGRLTVMVHDEDAGGEPIRIHGGPGTPVATVIAELYRELKTERKDGDRLICLGSGASVFGHEREHLEQYATHCPHLEWGWSRKTGGA
ncbi:MAG TPA: hypothetical protein VGF31_10410 [Myxococcaceae bacterium]|jgi:hypothetical protein